MSSILVTGGAGYIGSHTLRVLRDAGYELLVYDSLEKGHRAAVASYRLIVGDIADELRLDRVFREHPIDAVIHFAAYIEAGESVGDPGRYFGNNVGGSLALLRSMTRAGVRQLVFSSTAAVYGNPEAIPILEGSRLSPESPYGTSKLIVETMLDAFGAAHQLRSVRLRYFNAAGAHPSATIGEDHFPETHLIPLVLQTALGQRSHIAIHGDDYPTEDGTCVRDYVHVCDLADAHLLALRALERGAECEAYNVGSGEGASVLEVVETARRVTGVNIPSETGPRRPGDPARLVASSERIRRELGWSPRWPGLEEIVASAWEWHRSHPNGYGDR